MTFTTWKFWKAAIERSVKTFAQSLIAVGLAGATDLLGVDWGSALSIAGLAAAISILTSIGSDAVTTSDGPSLVNEIAVGRHAQ
jgi:hypothetical protein